MPQNNSNDIPFNSNDVPVRDLETRIREELENQRRDHTAWPFPLPSRISLLTRLRLFPWENLISGLVILGWITAAVVMIAIIWRMVVFVNTLLESFAASDLGELLFSAAVIVVVGTWVGYFKNGG